nr:hypothetical protein [Butyricicoccus sp. AF05-36]
MLGVNQLDFINYCNALKGNYRKGVHKMETLLENPTHAKEFANNLGGVSVVLGTPVGKEDRNSETLRSMLLASDVANDAVYTWMGQFYEFSSWDDLLSDASRCNEIMNDPLKSRAVSGSGVAVGKMVATIAGLSCSAYADMSAVAASSTAMAAIFRSSTALQVVQNNASAWAIFSNASSAVMGKTVAELAGLNPSGYADMNAIASSSTAMAAVANNKTALTAVINNASALNTVVSSSTAMTAIASSQTARAAIEKSQVAKDAIAASDMATAKYAVGAAGLKPADYANMAAVAASQTAMTAIASSQTAMTAIASSQTAMAAIATSSTAMSAISASTTAINALKASPLLVAKTKSGNNWTTETVRSGRGIAVYIYGASVSGGNGWVKTDNVQTTFSSNGTNQNLLKAFQTSLSVYWYQNSSTLYYIPC